MRMNLLSAREVKAKVLITAHVPPGYFERAFYGPMLKTNWTTQNINNDYADLMTNFTDVVSCKMSMILIVSQCGKASTKFTLTPKNSCNQFFSKPVDFTKFLSKNV